MIDLLALLWRFRRGFGVRRGRCCVPVYGRAALGRIGFFGIVALRRGRGCRHTMQRWQGRWFYNGRGGAQEHADEADSVGSGSTFTGGTLEGPVGSNWAVDGAVSAARDPRRGLPAVNSRVAWFGVLASDLLGSRGPTQQPSPRAPRLSAELVGHLRSDRGKRGGTSRGRRG
ncbi:hypothetical protein CC78DRAFT_549008 [Lojkania enalia]|uniref:Uncharacterized protein n=1 Tax=Lojkania enalia TaxID=147567 RepID=A0A9P4JZL2_9PLEO|nr:hypothetical protein CC78DRAFT_549008 [Didymosphaeria enalia]